MGIVNVTPDSFSGDGLATPDRRDEVVVAAAGAGHRLRRGRRGDPRRGCRVDPAARPRTAIARRSTRRRRPPSPSRSSGAVAEAARRQRPRQHRHVEGQGGARGVGGRRPHRERRLGRRPAMPDTAVAAAEADAHLVLMHNQEAPSYPAGVFETVVGWLRAAVEAAVEARSRAPIGSSSTPASASARGPWRTSSCSIGWRS